MSSLIIAWIAIGLLASTSAAAYYHAPSRASPDTTPDGVVWMCMLWPVTLAIILIYLPFRAAWAVGMRLKETGWASSMCRTLSVSRDKDETAVS